MDVWMRVFVVFKPERGGKGELMGYSANVLWFQEIKAPWAFSSGLRIQISIGG